MKDNEDQKESAYVPQLLEMYPHMDIRLRISRWWVHADVLWKDYHVAEKIKYGDVIAAINGAINKLYLLWKQGT